MPLRLHTRIQPCAYESERINLYRIQLSDENRRSIPESDIVFSSPPYIRGLLEKYPTFGREKETGLLGALDT